MMSARTRILVALAASAATSVAWRWGGSTSAHAIFAASAIIGYAAFAFVSKRGLFPGPIAKRIGFSPARPPAPGESATNFAAALLAGITGTAATADIATGLSVAIAAFAASDVTHALVDEARRREDLP